MNLIGEGWIPVTDSSGGERLAGLEELYRRAGYLRDLRVTPPQRIALMRLLICITQAALQGPRNAEDWLACRERIIPESIAYLQRWTDRFHLYGERPFLQVPELEDKRNAVLDKLDFGLSSGNNDTLFDQNAQPEGRAHPPSWQALNLLTYQSFSPGGLIGDNQWGGKSTGKNCEHAPGLEGSMLHTLLLGANLLDSLWLNLVSLDSLCGQAMGKPVWQCELSGADSLDADTVARSYLGRLCPLSRAIRLVEDAARFTLANGLAYPKIPLQRSSTGTVVIKNSKDGSQGYIGVDLERHPWRELCGILQVSRAGTEGGAPALKNLQTLRSHGRDMIVDLYLGGLAADKAKLLDTAEWIFSLDTIALGEQGLALYSQGVEQAESCVYVLRNAIRICCENQCIDGKSAVYGGYKRTAETIFWGLLDGRYGELVKIATGTPNDADVLQPWRQTIRTCMLQAYEQAVPHGTARQVQAFAIGRGALNIFNAAAAATDDKKEGGKHAKRSKK